MTTHYKQEGGQFHLYDDLLKAGVPEQTLVHSSKAVAVAYCQLPDRLHIFTHGTAEGMQKWVEAHNSHSPHRATLKVFGQSTPLETVNKAFVDPEFLASLVQRDPF